ncbi:MAG: hypothetical protein AAGF04_01950 [Chlamydiota bacterium]
MSVTATGTTEWTKAREELLSRQSILAEFASLIDWTSVQLSQNDPPEWVRSRITSKAFEAPGEKTRKSAISILEKINSEISKDARYKTIADIFTSSLKFLRALCLAQKESLSVLGGKIQATNQQEGQTLVLPEVVLNIPFVIKSLSEILDSETRGNEKPSKDRWPILQKGNFEASLVFRAQEGAPPILFAVAC